MLNKLNSKAHHSVWILERNSLLLSLFLCVKRKDGKGRLKPLTHTHTQFFNCLQAKLQLKEKVIGRHLFVVIACICIADERKFQKVMLSFNAANDEVANRPLNHYKLLGGNGGYYNNINHMCSYETSCSLV